MNVYLYQNNTEKVLKNIYIGEYKAYEYSYDFRNKTTTQLTNDWWTIQSWSIWINSGWIYVSSAWNPIVLNTTPIVSLSEAKKVTITEVGTWSNAWASYIWFATSTWRWWSGWIFAGTTLDTNSGVYGWSCNSTVKTASWISWWTYTIKVTLDLESKTMWVSCTGKSDLTQALSDADVSVFRSMPYVWFNIWWWSGTWTKIQSIKYEIIN